MPAVLRPPVGLPSDATVAEERAWSSLVARQLTDTRKAAENWKTGLGGMLALISGLFIIKGPEEITGLPLWAAVVAGVALLVACACAAAGAWQALAAAYGTPAVVSLDDVRRLGGTSALKLHVAQQSVVRLARAKVLAIATLIALGVAVGMTWYTPRSTAEYVQIEGDALPTLCGELVGSDQGALNIKPAGSTAVSIRLADVKRLQVVAACR